jgi:hypothetical protein
MRDVLLPPDVPFVLRPHGSHEVVHIHGGVDHTVHITQEEQMATCSTSKQVRLGLEITLSNEISLKYINLVKLYLLF